MRHHYYLMDGDTTVERQFLGEVTELVELVTIVVNFIATDPNEGGYTPAPPTPAPTPTPTPKPVANPVNFPWAQDGLTDIEREATGYLQDVQSRDEFVGGEVLNAPLLPDGIDEGERRLLCHIASSQETSDTYAIFLTNSP